ncbi:MAG: LemA family protein [Lewinellaceae bacterium]|nr:LemA family protein [Lewinellaceae bacterium]
MGGPAQQRRRVVQSIDVFLKQRYDLIPNLVNTIKGYTEYESSTLEKVIQACSAAMNAAPADKAEAEGQLAGTLKNNFCPGRKLPQPEGQRAVQCAAKPP